MSKAIKWILILLPVIIISCQRYQCYAEKGGNIIATIEMQQGNDNLSAEGVDKACKSIREYLND